MKKLTALILSLCLLLACAAATAEISLRKGDLAQNKALDKNVTNVLVLVQDGDATHTMLLASVNSRTGRAVLTELDTAMTVSVYEEPDAPGETALADVYALGSKKSRGMLAMKKVNELLSLNISSYLAMDMEALAAVADAVGGLDMELDAGEAEAMGMPEGDVLLSGEDVVRYARVALPDDYDNYNRCYIVLFELLEKGFHSDMGKLMGVATKLLKGMDTNVSVMNGILLANAVAAGSDRNELDLPQPEHILGTEPLVVDGKAMTDWLYKEIYE